MFKIMVIQTLNNLSDEQNEYLIDDRLSFMRFLGLVECHDMAVSRASKTSSYYYIDGLVQSLWRHPAEHCSSPATLRRRIFEQDGFHKTGRTNRQSCPTRIVMHAERWSSRKHNERITERSRQRISSSHSLAINHTFPSTKSSCLSVNGRQQMQPHFFRILCTKNPALIVRV